MFHPSRLRALVVLAVLLAAPSVFAQLRVVTVPHVPGDPSLPQPAYEGRPVRLKAIARGATGTVYFRWDANGDGVWDLDVENPGGADPNRWYAGTPEDIGFAAFYPDVDRNTLFMATVEVSTTPGSGSGSAYGQARVMVFDGFPDPRSDPAWAEHADPWQRGVMAAVERDDALWHLHHNMVRSGSGTNQIMGYTASGSTTRDRLTGSALHLKALLDRGYLPAYPPGTYEELGVTPPAGFLAASEARWNSSPYAEDALRLLNYLLANVTSTLAVPAADEADDGATPIPGTNDGVGWSVTNQLIEYSPCLALAVPALASSGLAGTVAQVGGLARGRTVEFVVQQLVDYLVAAQYDENSGAQAVGAWGYDPCLDCGAGANVAYAQHFGWAVHALHEAEAAMGGAGVIVNGRVKSRLPNMLAANPHADGGPRYTTAGYGSTWSFFESVGHALLACRWLGWDQFSTADGTSCGYPSISLTRGQARQIHDGYLGYAASRWNQSGPGSLPHTDTVLWSDGDPTSRLRGHSWLLAMLATSHGPAGLDTPVGPHDWAADFAVDLVSQQRGASAGSWPYGYISNHYTNTYLGAVGQTALAAALLARIAPGPDVEPPLAPATFAVAYAAGANALTWAPSASPDVVAYRIYRGDVAEVPIDDQHLVQEVATTSWTDTWGGDWSHHYRLTAVDHADLQSDPVGPTTVTGVEALPSPATTRLGEARPNPFNPATRIDLWLARECRVDLAVYDLQGRLVRSLVDAAVLPAGRHEVVWRGRDQAGREVAAGTYLCRLRADGVTQVRPLAVVK